MLDQIQTDERLTEHNQLVAHVGAHAQKMHQQCDFAAQLHLITVFLFIDVVPPFGLDRQRWLRHAFDAVFKPIRRDIFIIVSFRRGASTTGSSTRPETIKANIT